MLRDCSNAKNILKIYEAENGSKIKNILRIYMKFCMTLHKILIRSSISLLSRQAGVSS